MEPRRIYDYRSPHCQPHRTAASDPGYRSLRAFLLVKRQGAMDHLRKPRPHETHAQERSRDRRERPDVPHSARPISLFRIGQSQAKTAKKRKENSPLLSNEIARGQTVDHDVGSALPARLDAFDCGFSVIDDKDVYALLVGD